MTLKDRKIIDDSEERGIPIFVLTAKDKHSVNALYSYLGRCLDSSPQSHCRNVLDRVSEFLKWQNENPKQVKIPD